MQGTGGIVGADAIFRRAAASNDEARVEPVARPAKVSLCKISNARPRDQSEAHQSSPAR